MRLVRQVNETVHRIVGTGGDDPGINAFVAELNRKLDRAVLVGLTSFRYGIGPITWLALKQRLNLTYIDEVLMSH